MGLTGYVRTVVILGVLIDGLLLVAAGRLYGFQARLGRMVLAVGMGGLYTYLCLQPGLYFLGNLLLRIICLAIMAIVAYGISPRVLRVSAVFAFLNVAFGGSLLAISGGGTVRTLCTAGMVCVLCCVKFYTDNNQVDYVPVELTYGGKHMCITALHDTGNTLRDPITGQWVLVIGGDVACELTGLTKDQLKSPLDSLDAICGLRLIPYHTVDSNNGFLLGMKLHNARIGSWRGSAVVAFAPEVLNREGTYQALTGGLI